MPLTTGICATDDMDWAPNVRILNLAIATYDDTQLHDDLVNACNRFLAATHKILRSHIRRRRRKHISDIVDSIEPALDKLDTTTAWQHTRAALRFGGRKPSRKHPPQRAATSMPHYVHNGEAITDAKHLAELQQEHFSKLEDARPATHDHITTLYNTTTPTAATTVKPLLQALPIRQWLATHFRRLKRGKAPGYDNITSTLLRLAPVESTRVILPIIIKASLLIQEPLGWKHGTAIPLPKKGGATLTHDHFRSTLLNSEVSKAHHAFLRSQLARALHTMLHDTMVGGRAHRSTSMACHHVRSFLHIQ